MAWPVLGGWEEAGVVPETHSKVPGFKQVCNGHGKTRNEIFSIKAIVAAEKAIGFYTVVNQDIFLIGMDHPDNLGAIVKVFDNFGVDFFNGIARGENFDGKIGSALEEAARGVAQSLKAIAVNKGKVGRSLVAVFQGKGGAGVTNCAKLLGFDVATELNRDKTGHIAMSHP